MTDAKPHPLAFPALLVGNVALAFGPWLVRLADTGAVATGLWRLVLAVPFLFLVARTVGQPLHKPSRALVVIIAVAALFYALDLAAWNAGIRMTKLGNATLFGNSGSFVFAIYGLWLAQRAPSSRQAVALLLAAGGSGLLMSGSYELSPRNFAGDLLTLVAGLLYGGYLIFIERARTQLQPMPLLIFAISSQVIGQGLLVYSIGTLPPLVVGLALLTQPAVAATVGWLAYGEGLSMTDLAGAVAIAAALVLVRMPERGLLVADDEPS